MYRFDGIFSAKLLREFRGSRQWGSAWNAIWTNPVPIHDGSVRMCVRLKSELWISQIVSQGTQQLYAASALLRPTFIWNIFF